MQKTALLLILLFQMSREFIQNVLDKTRMICTTKWQKIRFFVKQIFTMHGLISQPFESYEDVTETHSEVCQTSRMEVFRENSQQLLVFASKTLDRVLNTPLCKAEEIVYFSIYDKISWIMLYSWIGKCRYVFTVQLPLKSLSKVMHFS